MCERVTIHFGFSFDWMKKWRENFLSQSRAAFRPFCAALKSWEGTLKLGRCLIRRLASFQLKVTIGIKKAKTTPGGLNEKYALGKKGQHGSKQNPYHSYSGRQKG